MPEPAPPAAPPAARPALQHNCQSFGNFFNFFGKGLLVVCSSMKFTSDFEFETARVVKSWQDYTRTGQLINCGAELSGNAF